MKIAAADTDSSYLQQKFPKPGCLIRHVFDAYIPRSMQQRRSRHTYLPFISVARSMDAGAPSLAVYVRIPVVEAIEILLGNRDWLPYAIELQRQPGGRGRLLRHDRGLDCGFGGLATVKTP